MSASGKCYHCGKVKRLAMILTPAIEYVCSRCRKELGYGV